MFMSHHDDTWEFYQDNADEWRWRRTATNGECVGAATEGFSSESSAQDNARLVGYEGQFGNYDESCWEVYQSDNGEWRWRLTAKNGQNVCSASEGYSAKESCIANAERHGYAPATVAA